MIDVASASYIYNRRYRGVNETRVTSPNTCSYPHASLLIEKGIVEITG